MTDHHRRQELAERAYADATRVVVDVRTTDPATVWRWLNTMPREQLHALVTALACMVNANDTARELDQRINDVVKGSA